MPARRIHRKSRFGCDTCKKRRVKCDEVSPICGNCKTRQTPCHFSSLFKDSRCPMQTNSPLPPTPSSAPANESAHCPTTPESSTETLLKSVPTRPGPSSIDFHSSRRREELELLHFWYSKTSDSFTLEHSVLFKSHAVTEALKHEYLLDSIFALTSLHIASETSDPVLAASYVSTGLQYQNKAINSMSHTLESITPSNCDAVFMSSIILMASTVVSPFFPTGDHDQPERSTLNNVLILYEFLHGIGSIINVSRHWIETGPCRAMFKPALKDPTTLQLRSTKKEDRIYTISQLRLLNDSSHVDDGKLHELYALTINQLEASGTMDRNRSIVWLPRTSGEFIDELKNKKPMALAIILYWGVLLEELDQLWRAKLSGKKLVEDLSVILLSHGTQWDQATAWRKGRFTTQVVPYE